MLDHVDVAEWTRADNQLDLLWNILRINLKLEHLVVFFIESFISLDINDVNTVLITLDDLSFYI